MAENWDIIPPKYEPADFALPQTKDYTVKSLASAFGLPPQVLQAPTTFGASILCDAIVTYYQERLIKHFLDSLNRQMADMWDRRERTCQAGHLHATHAG